MGRLYKPSDDLTGCSRLAPIKFDFDLDVVNTPLLILQRGGCSFVVKARNA